MSAEHSPTSWRVEPLGKEHDRTAFSCGHERLDRYLKQQASQDARRRVAVPFVLLSIEDRTTIRGYYTLSFFAIELADVPPLIRKTLPSYPLVSVTLLGRLAVDRRHTGRGCGEFLLMDALDRALRQSSQIASAAVVVEAIDNHAAEFYRHFGFLPFPDTPGRLFVPMTWIARVFATRAKGKKLPNR